MHNRDCRTPVATDCSNPNFIFNQLMIGILFQKDQNVKLNNFLVLTYEANVNVLQCCILKVNGQ